MLVVSLGCCVIIFFPVIPCLSDGIKNDIEKKKNYMVNFGMSKWGKKNIYNLPP